MLKIKKMLSVILSISLLITLVPINSFSLPYAVSYQTVFGNFAKITSANFYGSDTTIINIQDLHNNKEVQDNIYNLLETLNKKYKSLEVYMEGAGKSVDFNKLSSAISSKNLSALMDSLYDNDKLSGAEYFGYKNNKILKPTEDKKIYEQNIQNYSFLIKNKQNIDNLLVQKYNNIKTLNKYLDKEQIKVLKLYNRYLNKRISSEKFYDRMFSYLNKRNVSALKYINTKLYVDVIKDGKKINQTAAQRQLQQVLLALKNNMDYKRYTDLIKDSNNLTDVDVVFSYLIKNVNDNDKITKYPDLFKLINLRELASLINPLDLIEEERQIVEDVLLSYSKYSVNKDVIFLNLFYQTYKKLLSANIASNEYVYYKQNYDMFYNLYVKYLQNDFFGLYVYTKTAENFNDLNLKRNVSFIDSLLSGVSVKNDAGNVYGGKFYSVNKILTGLDKAKSVKVIVSGGFHTEGINELLEEKKVSYITLTPNIKNADSLYERKYLNSILEQAEFDTNAISKKPFLQQPPQIIVGDIVASLDNILNYLQEGKSLKDIQEIVNGVIAANSLQDIITFSLDSEGIATIKVGEKVYTLNYENGHVKIENNFSTALGKNIKILVKQALLLPGVRRSLGLVSKGYNPVSVSGFNQIAEHLLMRHNILLPKFVNRCLTALMGLDENEADMTKDRVYNALLNAMKSFQNKEFEDAEIIIGKSPKIIGTSPDGYGNTEEYGSLFYVVWKNKNGVMSAKRILISDELFKYLNFFNERKTEEFFNDLFIHEKIENIAVSGESKRFNEYVLSNRLSRTSEVFHEYIKMPDFRLFLEEQGYSLDNAERQKKLLEELDFIISDVNKQKSSQYSDIVSLIGLEKGKIVYSDKDLETFLAVRAGDAKTIQECNERLVNKICTQIENEYVAEKKGKNADYDIEKDFDVADFINFLNNFAVVYRNTNKYVYSDKLAQYIKEEVVKRYNISKKQTEKIEIASYELQTNADGSFSLNTPGEIDGKKVLVMEDIISKQSNTFNNIYNLLKKSEASKVQGVSFFDLSKEADGTNLISEQTYARILREPQILVDIINNIDGNGKKYLAYWLVKLLNDKKGDGILRQISAMDEYVVKNLLASMFDVLKDKDGVKNVKNYEIVNLMMFIGFGEKKDINDMKKEEIDEFLNKYGFRAQADSSKPLEVFYDDWSQNVSALILYAYMSGYSRIEALGVNNLNAVNKENNNKKSNRTLIADFCKEFGINFEDKKTKLIHSHTLTEEKETDAKFLERINGYKKELDFARADFEEKAKKIAEKYQIESVGLSQEQHLKYLTEIEHAQTEYSQAVKNIMIQAKNIALEILVARKEKIKIEDDSFLIMIGGSLSKGNMTESSEVYYDIVVPDGTVSVSVEEHFAPLYSSILQQIGLNNYHVLKYSTTRMNRRNINTFIDEKEIAPFLNFETLSTADRKKSLYTQYMDVLLKEGIENINTENSVADSLALITKKYYTISQEGSGWMGNSFNISYDNQREQTFSTRSSLMAFETRLNEIIFAYSAQNKITDSINVPVSVQAQIEFIKNKIYTSAEQKAALDKAYEAWRYLSSCRYVKRDNSWTPFTYREKEAAAAVNEFVSSTTVRSAKETKKKNVIRNYGDLLALMEEFVYDNSVDIDVFRNGYSKYSHLETWKQSSSKENENMFVKAQIISLLIDIDSPQLREKLSQYDVKGLNKYLPEIFESLDKIKFIDENFPQYSSIDGERSIQYYWNAIAKSAGNTETVFALIAHKLNKAQMSKNKEDKLLLFSVYLPLSRRFGNSDIYEYVRNNVFEYSHSSQYLNLLKILKTLYGLNYSEVPQYDIKLRDDVYEYLRDNGIPAKAVNIKYRVKSLYSIYEKLTSSRKKDKELKPLNKTEKNAVMFMMKNKNSLFDAVIANVSEEGVDDLDKTKERILKLINTDFNDLQQKEKELLNDLTAEMKKAIFTDYEIVDYVNGNLSVWLEKCKGDDGYSDIDKLKQILEDEGMFFELWFVELFEDSLKDFVGLHVVVQDERYKDVVKVLDKGSTKETPYADLRDVFYERSSITFKKFKKDEGNKQARLKLNASIKADRVPIPVEICFYEKSDYENETYGLYNTKKISSPHYIYKMGKEAKAMMFEHIFSNELDYEFIEEAEKESSASRERKENVKNMVFVSDEFVPSENLTENFDRIVSPFSDTVTCFVDYDDKIYIRQLPKGATVFDLALGKHFSGDLEVSVYTDKGEPLTSDVVLDNSRVYKVIKEKEIVEKLELPKNENKIFTVRSKLIYRRETARKGNSVSEFLRHVSANDIEEISTLLLSSYEYREILDNKSLSLETVAEQICGKNKDSENEILKNKQLMVEYLRILNGFVKKNKLEKINRSTIMQRSIQIAGHYDLLNMFELFEAQDYNLIDFRDIKEFYQTYILIKTKSKKVTEEQIAKKIAEKFEIEETEEGYNFAINDKKYFIGEANIIDSDFIETLAQHLSDMDSITLRTDVFDKNDKIISDEKDSAFIMADFVLPENPLPLISLGNNVEELVKHAAKYHSDMVKQILVSTKAIADEQEFRTGADTLNSLLEEEPVLMAQVLLGLFSKDSYEEDILLSQQTPLLSQGQVDEMKYVLQTELSSENISEVKIVVSRTLDLAHSQDAYSFSTISVKDATAVLYISEAFLKELDKKPEQIKEYLLRQLVIHETSEYLALSKDANLDYIAFHKRLEQDSGQRDLMNFARSIVGDVLRMKNALFEETDVLLYSDEIPESDPSTTAAIICGNRMLSSFEKTFNLYREGKVDKIFISGNTRGSLDLLTKLRASKYSSDIAKTSNNLVNPKSIEDFLSLTDEAFKEIAEGKVKISLTDEVCEASIIKWVILKCAADSELTDEEITVLENNIILETVASNTPENFRNIVNMKEFRDFVSENKDGSQLIIIQTPFSQVRAKSTLNKIMLEDGIRDFFEDKNVVLYNVSTGVSSQDYHFNSVRALTLSLGEWTRIIAYTLKGDIVPTFNDEHGLGSIPLEALKNILALLPVASDQEKESMFKIFDTVAQREESFKTKESVLSLLASQIGTNSNEYKLISEFITYLYSDTTEQRQLEKLWAEREEAASDTDTFVQHQILSIEEQISRTHSLLASA